ncbi:MULTISPECIES: carbohydrate ABC transporter permease [Streptomyces]|uniref:carbohydrate ABC transporter permease n=1 Tax=Streptomyces TaxID=1883 RepID=UPI0003A9A6A8|nr:MULTISPECIES: sugar ABC transporter permease [Streptomyces]MBZ6112606.1 sugar ABC transporter permease [Streptomyces olivaceus]MBZ6126131.1 sugar ABC transporter permease [Streptomyces olivaceus]MBZ6147233.1 sugar ABC transporter permease [Streptomyces olivaceus]MBZ6160983.1 sugar ABC transporter permease [Streptomyces olivaceus]MBZ6188074.1 sugar ABC transporter permease [Streptomyces olivaceus]
MATTTPTRGASTPPPSGGPRTAYKERSAWRSRLWRFDDKASPYAYIAPFFLIFGAFGLYPLIYTGWIALHRVEMTSLDQSEWVGLDNFATILQDSEFWTAVSNTFIIGVISTVPQLMVALGLAHLLNYKLRASTFWRTIILTPYATSVATAALVFALVFRADGGLLNWVLEPFGGGDIDWGNGHWTSKIAISIIVIWRWTGYNALIYLAAMQAVPSDLYEAASIDGASRWQQFRKVTIPSLRPTILFTIVISTIGSMQLFGEPLLLQGGTLGSIGGSEHQYETLSIYLYNYGWKLQHLGLSAAVAWAMLVLLLLIALINWIVSRFVRKSAA